MRHFTAIGCIVALCAAFAGNANAATAQFDATLYLTNLQYPVTIDTPLGQLSGNAAADILRFDVGIGWNGPIEILLTTGSYGDYTSLGVAFTTDPNNELFKDPRPFLQLAQSGTDVDQFFDDNVSGWVFYAYGSPYVSPGVTNTFNPSDPFNPNEHYYAFIAGGSVVSTTVDVGLTVSSPFPLTPPASVPVPAAVWLFGSGLIGLIGMAKRKKS